jgi:TolB-like protein
MIVHLRSSLIALAVMLAFAENARADAPAAPQPPKRRVAVLEFQGALPAETLQVITDSARVGALDVANALGLVVMTRESMAVMLRDMGKDLRTCTEGSCEVETGRLIGADLLVTGQVTRVDARYVVTVKSHETKGGALLKSEQIDTADQFQLLSSVKDATRRCLEPKDAGPAGNVVYSVSGAAKDAPATAGAAIDAAYAARHFAICSKIDTGSWTFCEGGKTNVTENEFARRYKAQTGLTDLEGSNRRRNWGSTTASIVTTAGLAGLSAFCFKQAGTAGPETYDSNGKSTDPAAPWIVGGVFSSLATIGSLIWMISNLAYPDGTHYEHDLPVPAARGAVDRMNSALKQQLHMELGPQSEAPARRDEPTVRVTPYVSPLGMGLAGTF